MAQEVVCSCREEVEALEEGHCHLEEAEEVAEDPYQEEEEVEVEEEVRLPFNNDK